MSRLEQGIGRYDSAIPKKLPAGIVKPAQYPSMKTDIGLEGGAQISTHCCEAGVSLEVHNNTFYGIQIRGSFEQLRYLLAEWSRQLDEMEAEAKAPVAEEVEVA